MRILHVITGLDVGGAERLLIDVVLNLKRAGHDVSIIYFKSGPHEKTLKDCNIAVVHVRGFFFTYDPFLIFTLYKVIKKINPDCIHGWLWMANLLSRIVAHLLSIPQLSSLHNNVDQDGFVRNCIDKYTYNYAQKLVPISQGVAYSLAKKHPWICTKSVHVVPNGIDSAAICEQIAHKKKKRIELELFEHDFVIGSVGRFVHLKNYGLLIETFAVLHASRKNTKLVLLGYGPQEHLLKNKAISLNIDYAVRFVIREESYGYYPLLDCFVLTSYKEGISMALLEAMSYGLPCVVTNDDLIHDVITHEKDGILINSSEPEKIAAVLKRLMDDQFLRNCLAMEARKTVRNFFDTKIMMQQYKSIYQELIAENRLS